MKNYQHGYVAIASVLVITVVVLIIGTSIALLSINEIQSAYSNKTNEKSLDLVEACTEDALLQLNESESLPTSISLPEGTCSVTTDSHSGGDWTFTVTGEADNSNKSIQVETTRSTTIDVVSWKEI